MARPSKAQTETTQNADPVDKLPKVTLSGAVSAVLNEAVEQHRWSSRMSRADVMTEALTEWADSRGLLPDARKALADKIAKDAPESE